MGTAPRPLRQGARRSAAVWRGATVLGDAGADGRTRHTRVAQMPRIWCTLSARASFSRSWGSEVNGPSIFSSFTIR